MNKSIHTLIYDINRVLDGEGGWDAAITKYCAEGMADILQAKLEGKEEQPKGTLRMSGLGTPCERKLWYSVNTPSNGEPLAPSAKLKFLYGDILEQLLISLAIAAGHKVEGVQDTLEIAGVIGHRDCVIDGVTVDVKSASTYSFKKFENGNLREDDPFGYISQLSSYVYAGRNSEVESHPTLGAFLVIDKTLGKLCLDMYDFGPELLTKEEEVKRKKGIVAQPDPPPRGFSPEPEGKSGNMKLGLNCSYCERKNICWPELRTFLYSYGPVYLTKVVKTPNVREV